MAELLPSNSIFDVPQLLVRLGSHRVGPDWTGANASNLTASLPREPVNCRRRHMTIGRLGSMGAYGKGSCLREALSVANNQSSTKECGLISVLHVGDW